ncbi:MAG: DUF1566 domain-containing protein, partial [Phycisphaerae bacterium]|nr:DUF1566 domain-containing protein [Phycisphaerae bacterium]
MRKFILTIILILCLSSNSAFAGSLDQTSPPSNDSTRMYTLEQIYDVIAGNETTWPAKPSGGFNEPATGPASTMHTLDNIQGLIVAGVTDATAANILSGKTAISRGAGTGESLLTGIMPNLTLSASTVAVPAGYYGAGDALNVVDTDLAAGNIKSGTTIFGILGTYAGGSFGIPKTGQTTSYQDYDDGYYKKGTPASGAHFTKAGNLTTDNGTGLMWVADHAAIGTVGGYNFASTMSWSDALLAVTALNSAAYGGYSDWRLPNIKELQSIVDYGRVGPAIDTTYFPNAQSYSYWSSTTLAGGTVYAWYVYFDDGYVGYDNKAFA